MSAHAKNANLPDVTDGFGPRPVMRDLPVASLHVDETYQRDIESRRSQALITRLADDFRWAKFGVVQVTPWPEKGADNFAIIDGQHRVAAARRNGIAAVPCLIYDGLSVAEAAAVFVDVNRNRVAVNPMAMHHAELAAGDPQARLVDRVCKAARVEITRYPIPANKLEPGQTLAIGAIRTGIRQFGEELVTEALKILSEGFYGQAGRIRADVIRGACLMLSRHQLDDATRAKVVAWLFETGIEDMRARLGEELLMTGAPGYECASRVLAQVAGLEQPPASMRALPGDARMRGGLPARAGAVPEEIAAQFSSPKHRRCKACNAVFSTKMVHKHRCDACIQAGRVAA